MIPRIKKFVHHHHRKSDGAPQTPPRDLTSSSLPYEEAVPGNAPTQGKYPIRGRNSGTYDEYDRSRSQDPGAGYRQNRHTTPSTPIKRPSSAVNPTIIPVSASSSALPVDDWQDRFTADDPDYADSYAPVGRFSHDSDVNKNLPPTPPNAISERHDTSSPAVGDFPSGSPVDAQSRSRTGRSFDFEPESRRKAAPSSSSPTTDRLKQSTFGVSPQSRKPVPPKAQPSTDRSSPDANTIMERAKTNTVDSDVTEYVSPAVTHETVHRHIHHIHEERITREIHNHDIHHRILPIVDVEVLPARHFLPVQGGGLVEVSADDVPSRGKNWIIAETLSKIPSGRPAPAGGAAPGRRRFTAREFPGSEGDDKRYITPEGYEKTEQTWIHPPAVETGARDTGQTWPVEIGNLSLNK